MTQTLASLFSPTSPTRPPPPRSPTPESPTPSSPRRDRHANPLFLSPGSSHHPTPNKRARASSPARVTPRPADTSRGTSLPPLLPLEDEFVDPFAGLDDAARDEADVDGKEKKRRVVAKIDGDRLMSDRGIPALMRAAKRFRPRGKGYEAADLRALLNMYQMWAHGMFPKGDFAGTIARVEVVCRTRRMENAMKGYRDAFYPPPPSPTPPPRSSSELRLTPPLDQDNDNDEHPRGKTPLFDDVQDGGEPDVISGHGGVDDVDVDEMMALEEMEREQRAQAEMLREEPPAVNEEDEWEGLYD